MSWVKAATALTFRRPTKTMTVSSITVFMAGDRHKCVTGSSSPHLGPSKRQKRHSAGAFKAENEIDLLRSVGEKGHMTRRTTDELLPVVLHQLVKCV